MYLGCSATGCDLEPCWQTDAGRFYCALHKPVGLEAVARAWADDQRCAKRAERARQAAAFAHDRWQAELACWQAKAEREA